MRVASSEAGIERSLKPGTLGECAGTAAHTILDEDGRVGQRDAQLLTVLADAVRLLRQTKLVALLVSADAGERARHDGVGCVLRE